MWYISSSCTLKTVCQVTSYCCAHPHAVKYPFKKYSVVAWMLLSFSLSVVSNSLRARGLQHAKLTCPLLPPGVYSNSCPLSWWCHPTISSSVVCFSSYLQSFPESWSFPRSFSFSISPSNEHSGLISFRIDRFDLFAVQGTLKSLLQYHSSKASILRCSDFFMVQLSHP